MIAPMAVLAILYVGGYLAQFIGNYALWKEGGGSPGDGTAPLMASPELMVCFQAALRPPHGIYGIFICIGLLAVLLLVVMRIGYSDAGEYDEDRNFTYSAKGTYGTSGWMGRKEMEGVLDLVGDLRRHRGIVLGMLDRKYVCVPEETRLNSNLAVYGASGSMKTRSFCMNRILQGVSRGESLVICDPKSELYEKSSEYLRDKGYTVRVFNLVNPENSDSWNCLAEVEGQELMAQLFVDVIIRNTKGDSKGDHFWDSAEMNLLKALVLYVDRGYPEESRNMGQVYQLLTLNSETALNSLFDVLPATHPAKAPYSLFKQASDTVRSGVVIGLGSRLQVFQSELIRKITARDEIDLELPGQEPCAYFLVTSDQDSTFDFLASLFLSFVFIKLVRYADKNCEGGKLSVPVHVLGEELTACGTIPDLSRRLSVIRSRNISMSCVFQNLAGLQNRYPQNLWQEILGNADVQLFLGCTDPLTAEFVSSRTGLASVAVSSKSKQLGTWRISNYTPEFRETSGVGKRPVLTPDEVLRLPIDKALVIIRGKKTLKVDKMDYSKHPEYPLLRSCKASAHVPEWRRMEMEAGEKKAGTQRAGAQKAEIQGAGVQKRAEAQKSRLQGAGTKTAGMQGAKDNAGIKKEMAQKTWAQKAEDAQDASGDRATAETRNAGKEEAAKASPKAASKTEPKAPAGNAKQTAGRRASGNGATGRTVPGKADGTAGKLETKTEPDVNTGSGQPAGVVLTDKDSIML
ncbi:VirD4-like conjugal transfer protein, CD1115 family [uncultured Acetatifactor sp.]|uniref:VirD4-like conjugal transfer protein, CD1115 family n=1 Tax=uncultured Acetatifactor sp. TaxID=1671927 RepID=UPI002621CACE|nr:type IV secretory system conjugative DNA transfer family protein [uncultured Acetatifactor sp.]